MSRETVLALLRAQKENFISGEELSRQLSLSRTAVWKAVDALRRAGYTIEARSGLGYRLLAAPDALTEAEIRHALGETKVVGRKLCCLEEVDSTNTYAKKLALAGGEDGTVIIADCQPAGRGRMDRSFASPKGKGIYLTALLRPELPPERLLPVTALAGVAVCEAAEQVTGLRPQLKWPNDPVVGGRKVCGILTEMGMEAESGRLQYLILGIGINVGQRTEEFPPELREMAVSLSEAAGKPVSRPQLAAALIGELDRLYCALLRGDTADYLAAYRRDCVNLGRTVQLIAPGRPREQAEALDVDEQFGLVVRGADGTVRTIRSGEVSVRGMYGYAD